MQPQPTGIIYPIPFDEPADLDYLGVTSNEVRRNIQRLANQGLLEKVLEGHARPTDVYTTLEPCTSRSHPKVPCAIRLTERKVARVVIGMLDPDVRIRGSGMWTLRQAGIAIGLFPHDLMAEISALRRFDIIPHLADGEPMADLALFRR